ncbi:hypothetical protein MMC19_000320 [Ptychographa xylographoides]|nr:hypothetical protein [Ptychographa xylographoides]
MATYEVEHNITHPTPSSTHRPRRPDLSTFFSTLELVDTSNTENVHAVPIPGDISAAFRMLADAFERMRQDAGDGADNGDLLENLVETLLGEADAPPKEVKGVSDEFLADLERVPRKALKKDMSCPICNNPFLDDEYPLVVRLPCHKSHIFDLECIQPWLKLHPTCPLDRKNLIKKKEVTPPPPKEEEEDGEYDDMYA